MIPAAVVPFSRVYRRGITIGISDMLAYRGAFFIQFFFQLFPLVTQLLLWTAVYAGNPAGAAPGGYAAPQMLSYFLVLNMLRLGTFMEDLQWTLPNQIRRGELNKFLLRPVDFVMMEWHMRMGGVLMSLGLLLIPAGLVFAVAHRVLVVPAELWQWGAFGLATVLGIQIGFLVSLCVGFVAFWILDTTAFLHAIFPVQILLGGGFFPLELLPRDLYGVLRHLPWSYQTYLPMQIYLGKLGFGEAMAGLAGQAGWIAALFLLSLVLWKRGLRRYAAVGG